MHEIDLIPQSYRRKLALRRLITPFGLAYGVVVVCLVAAKLFLSVSIDAQATQIQELQADKNSVMQKKAHIEQLLDQRKALTGRVEMLDKLRGGPPVNEVFIALDRALQGGVWFVDWRFMRAGEFVDVQPQSVNAGYFIIVPETPNDKRTRAWRMHTHMEIKAQALDHSVLAEFVQRLSTQAFIQRVKVLNTRSRHASGSQFVEFELAIVVGRSEAHG